MKQFDVKEFMNENDKLGILMNMLPENTIGYVRISALLTLAHAQGYKEACEHFEKILTK